MENLNQKLINLGYLKSPQIIHAFEKIKRRDFVIQELFYQAEENVPLSIGHGQTISQPLTVAFMLELLDPQPGQKILDIGSGSGWTAALLAEIVGEKGKIFAIERIEVLKIFGEKNVDKYGFVKSKRVVFKTGNGIKGLIKESPFDRIHVGAAANKIPEDLLKQLAIGGKMVIPQGINFQDIVLIEKRGKNQYQQKNYPGFAFVPLIEEKK
ncbi:MAG: protein-L-isoaspartate O-methyltransferase [Patescibacteria group bacterium]|jgi:protein-L-isoaspartate(D-aspartate) O-methyltransferase|nr:protein-L-isoaspartate O-methyltransferase [Patescibacteria group bacterium]MDD5172788.1 protein-L-isoaspartate O-methyltransferase [Patescibacteria group bacterium]